MINLQDKTVSITNPIEIDLAVEQIRQRLALLPWVSHPFHIAQRFYKKEKGKAFYYPETYISVPPGEENPKKNYHRLTPDNDYSGMFFFYVGDEKNEFEPNSQNYLNYPVSIIFSANLELIDEEKLKSYLFTQELIRDARRVLTNDMLMFNFTYTIDTVSRDLKKVYSEFVLEDLEQYNRAPIQCFRINLTLKFQEECF